MSNQHLRNTSELFQSVNTPVRKEEMIPFAEYLQAVSVNEKENAAVEWLCEKAGVERTDFYHLPNHGITPFCYYKDGVFLAFNILDITYLEWTNMGEGLEMKIEMTQKDVAQGNFSRILDLSDTIGRPLVFEYFFHHMPEEKKYELFIDLYVLQEYGFAYYDPAIVKELLEKQPKELRGKAQEAVLKESGVKEGEFITIYRGMGSASTPVEHAMSWTLSEQVAHFFANRLGNGGYIVEAQIKISDVIDYIDRRNEKEVIVLPNHMPVIRSHKPIDTAEEMQVLEDKGLVQEFQLNVTNLLQEDAFKNPQGIHGVLHMKRVLLHCLSLSNAIGLPENERGVLVLTAVYHDIGRTHDYRCTEHGKWSVEKKNERFMPDDYLTVNEWGEWDMSSLTDDEVEVMEFLMTHHCRHDKDAEAELMKMEEGEKKEMIQRLFPIFKDADALDRVRIGDLDASFLRTSEAKQRLRFAQDVYRMLT